LVVVLLVAALGYMTVEAESERNIFVRYVSLDAVLDSITIVTELAAENEEGVELDLLPLLLAQDATGLLRAKDGAVARARVLLAKREALVSPPLLEPTLRLLFQ
jgi:hypothetical protein